MTMAVTILPGQFVYISVLGMVRAYGRQITDYMPMIDGQKKGVDLLSSSLDYMKVN